LQHFMPSNRLQWAYARKLLRYHGASHVLLDAYSEHSLSSQAGFRRWLSERWWYQFGSALGRMASRPCTAIAALLSNGEGRNDILEIERQFGRALGLLQHTKRYGDLRRGVRDALWRSREDHSRDRFERRSENRATIV